MALLRKLYYFLIDILQTLLLAASVFIVIYIFLFRPYQVTGSSMYPNFINKEYVLTNLISLRIETLRRGDVIVFHAPNNPEKDYIKRIIGLPGDTVSLRNGDVFINNIKLDENTYLDKNVKTYGGSFLQDGASITVPEESYFVMGDNRGASSDSREWGAVKKDKIIGKSFFVYWPPQDAKLIKNPFN